jgi:murein DD-endopeptidase MepM/ murein hydrolase activator NlpD
MIRNKLKLTTALVLAAVHLLAVPASAAAESTAMSLQILPAYIMDLKYLLQSAAEEAVPPGEAVPEDVVHVVARGENLIRIARMYEMEVDVLVALNGISNPDHILVGQELKVQLPAEIKYTLARGDTLVSLAAAYGVELPALMEANHVLDPFSLPVGTVITIPNPTRLPLPKAAATASRSGAPARTTTAPVLVWPLRGTITSRFGVLRSTGYHLGLDIAAPTGTPIVAAAGGTVTAVGYQGSYGLLVALDHGNGWSTLYAHASKVLVSVGQQVTRGEEIARVGSTGNATGPHVHFEVIQEGKRLNPEVYLPR